MKLNTRCPGATPTMGATPIPSMPAMGQCLPCPQQVQYSTCCQVVEPTVTCCPQQHHYHRVDHIKPVVIRNMEHHHTHHNFITNIQPSNEAFLYDEYLASQTIVNPTTQAAPVQVNQLPQFTPTQAAPVQMNQLQQFTPIQVNQIQQVGSSMPQNAVSTQSMMNAQMGTNPQDLMNDQMGGFPQGMMNSQMGGFPQGMMNSQGAFPQGMMNSQMGGFPQGMMFEQSMVIPQSTQTGCSQSL